MARMSTMFSIAAIKVFLRNSLIFLLLLASVVFVWLKMGIQIDTLKVANYSVQGLYIKLDKKFNLKASKVIVPRRKSKPSFEHIDKTLENVKYILTFFDEIEVNEIHFKNNILAIHFFDEELEVSSKDYAIRGTVRQEGHSLEATVSKLVLKKYDVTLQGSFSYDLADDVLVTKGSYNVGTIFGDFTASKKENEIRFSLNSNTFSALKPFVEKFNISPGVKSWIVDKVQAKKYRLAYLEGKGNIEDKTFVLDSDSLKGEMLFSNFDIYFKEGLEPVKATSVRLNYYKEGLFFDLEKPRYLDKNLTGSKVSIVNLKDENTTLHVNLKLHDSVDVKVQNLLKAYHVPLPVLQEKGKVKGSIDITIGLKNRKKHFKTDLQFMPGDVWIEKLKLPIISGYLHYVDSRILLEKIRLKDKVYAGVLKADIDLKKSKIKGIFEAEYIKMSSKSETLLSLTKKSLPFELNYKKTLELKVPVLALKYRKEKERSVITLSDFKKVSAYVSKDLPISEGGKIEIVTKDFEAFTYKGMLNFSACFLYEAENLCRAKVDFEGKVLDGKIDFYAFNKHFYYNQKKELVKLSKLNFDLKKFLETKSKDEKNKTKKKSEKKKKVSKKKKPKTLHILGKKSNLRYGDHTLLLDSYDVKMDKNSHIQAIGNADGDIIQFSKVDKIISIEALRIKDKILHPLINFDGLHHGRYTLNFKGNPGKNMQGQILVEGGVMRDFKAYNNTLAFINTIPALATLDKPGYSDKGFVIQNGTVDFRSINTNRIILDKIEIKGETSTIFGSGEFDLKKRSINVILRIQLAKSLGTVVGNIPVLGYILVGKDKSVTIGLKITGSLDKPKVSVSTVEDVLSYPIEVIKRTLETPKRILKPVKKEKKEKPKEKPLLQNF
ncbi:MAG: hypothetical protein GQ531_10055 [Sulfurovum sp.]|nr:hypothetical protein [Sulfurovum sp.]